MTNERWRSEDILSFPYDPAFFTQSSAYAGGFFCLFLDKKILKSLKILKAACNWPTRPLH